MIQSVVDFNQQILGIPLRPISNLNWDEMWFTQKALLEEIEEYCQAWNDSNLEGQVDALADLVYFAIGAMYKMGLNTVDIQKVFEVIHRANMAKKAGVSTKRHEEVTDAVKPEDWVSPNKQLRILLEEVRLSR